MSNTKKRLEFWEMLEANQFVKSTDSITDQVKKYPPAIQDMEAVVAINGVFDKYAIDEWLAESIQQAELEMLKKVTKIIEKEKYTWAKESIGNKALQSMEKALQEYI